METTGKSCKISWNKGSYPTYEEWKLSKKCTYTSFSNRSYPTYEEWKLSKSCDIILSGVICSYPTYEEWKQYSLF